MATTTARVPTPHASRYLQQLCKHWSHSCKTEFDAISGSIDLDNDRHCGMRVQGDYLIVSLITTEEKMPQLQDVVADHLQRFAHREGTLPFFWESGN